MDALIRGMIENTTDKYIEDISGVDEGILKVQELLDEYNVSDKSTSTKDLLMGYHLGRMLQFTISRMGSRGENGKLWTPEDIWSIIQSKLTKLSAKIETELAR
jgi:hypothetical protein